MRCGKVWLEKNWRICEYNRKTIMGIPKDEWRDRNVTEVLAL